MTKPEFKLPLEVIGTSIFSADGLQVATFAMNDFPAQAINQAEYMAMAINSHAELVAALERVIDAVHPSGMFCHNCGINSRTRVHTDDCCVYQAEQILSKITTAKGSAK